MRKLPHTRFAHHNRLDQSHGPSCDVALVQIEHFTTADDARGPNPPSVPGSWHIVNNAGGTTVWRKIALIRLAASPAAAERRGICPTATARRCK